MTLGDKVRSSTPNNYKPLFALLAGRPATAAKRLEESDGDSPEALRNRVAALELTNTELTQTNAEITAELLALRSELGQAIEYFDRIAAARE